MRMPKRYGQARRGPRNMVTVKVVSRIVQTIKVWILQVDTSYYCPPHPELEGYAAIVTNLEQPLDLLYLHFLENLKKLPHNFDRWLQSTEPNGIFPDQLSLSITF
jgi:hypothetical protein